MDWRIDEGVVRGAWCVKYLGTGAMPLRVLMNRRNVPVRKTLPHPGPLPLGEGESYADDLKRRTMAGVQKFNARTICV